MKINVVLLFIALLLIACSENVTKELMVSDFEELSTAIAEAAPGTDIVMADGEWNDVRIRFYGKGVEGSPITLRAETPGGVIIQGQSDLKLGGEYLKVDGLYFKNGSSPSRAVIQFYLNEDTLANNCTVTNCVIESYNKPQKNQTDLWVLFKGRYNELSNSYLAGKANRGPTVRVDLEGNRSIRNYHKIVENHFGPRPPKGGPSAETIQIGNSYTSVTPSHTLVANNFFERCNGEVEVISSKTNFNEFRNNVFFKSQGSLVTRHGNYCIVDGNYFIGDEASPHPGGVRLIGTGHWITNNYFYKLRGQIFRGPLAVMNGIPKSPQNRYTQVTDVVVAYNSWIDCTSPWQFGVGSNIDQKEVLPPSEIRSETPIRTIVANNLIFNSTGDPMPILRYDSIHGIHFQSNVINNQGTDFRGVEGLTVQEFSMKELEENVWVPAATFTDIEPHIGFDFENFDTDLFGNSRGDRNSLGATNGANSALPDIMDMAQYGPSWFDSSPTQKLATTYQVGTSEELIAALAKANSGDIVVLTAQRYEIGAPLTIDKKLTIQSVDSLNKALISYSGEAETPLFELNPKGELELRSVILQGDGKNYGFASLKEKMSSLYNLKVVDAEITDFDYVLKAYKYSFSEFIKVESSLIKNCSNGLELSSEDDNKGEYNAENVYILNSRFDDVRKNVVDYYRGGYDESTVGGNLIVRGCTFTNSGAAEENGTLLNTYGIINVDISKNNFVNNAVNRIALLWGAKNNSHSENLIENSGSIVTQQNLPLQLIY